MLVNFTTIALFTHRMSEVVFITETISLGVFRKKPPGAKFRQPRQRGGFCQLSSGYLA